MSKFTAAARATGRGLSRGAGATFMVLAAIGEASAAARQPRFVIDETPILFGGYLYTVRKFSPETGEFTDIASYRTRAEAEAVRDTLTPSSNA